MLPTETRAKPTVLIVGAGMTGLSLADALPEFGPRMVLVDKGRRLGGRLATRLVGPGRADHGAQFIAAHSAEFKARVQEWVEAGVAFEWARSWSSGRAEQPAADEHPYYAVRDGMNALAKHIAAGASAHGAAVHTRVTLQAVSPTDAGWWACSDDGRVYTAQVLVLTCPVPEALAMLTEGSVALAASDRAALEAVEYAPALSVLLRVNGGTNLPDPGAVQQPCPGVDWIADNQRKGISPEAAVLTVHADPAFSAQHFAKSTGALLDALRPAFEPCLAPGATVDDVVVKRWRYAFPTVQHPERFLSAQGLPPLYFGGDAFGDALLGARIEGAALSGMAIADELRRRFASTPAGNPHATSLAA